MQTIVIAILSVTLVMMVIGALVPRDSQYAYWFLNNFKWLVTILVVSFFATVILWG